MNLTHLPVRALGAAAGVALLAGCTPADGGATATATPEPTPTATALAEAPAGTPDPCALVSRERLQEISGYELSDGVFNSGLSDSGRNVCDWGPASDEQTTPRVVVTVNWGFPDLEEHRALSEEIHGESRDVEIEGAVGAYAFPGYRSISMGFGDHFIKVSYIQPDNPDGGHVCAAIAREVAANFLA